jgi:hypothetical protein
MRRRGAAATSLQVFVEEAAGFGHASRVNRQTLPPRHAAPSIPTTTPAPQSKGFPFKRFVFLCLLSVILVGGLIVLTLKANDHRLREPRLSSAVWTAQADGQPRLYFVMEEERSQRRHRGSVYPYTVTYSLFTLRSRDARTGDVTGEQELARIDNAGDGPLVIGPQGSVLWMWNDGLVAMSLSTLKPVWSAEKLKQLNPELGAFLPVDRKYYKVLERFNALAYKGADARYYQVDDATGKISILDEAALASHDNHGRAEQAFSEMDSPGQPVRNLGFMGVLWNSFTHEDKWYALLTTEARAKLYKAPGRGSTASGEDARQLYRGNFTWEDRPALGSKEVLLDMDTVAPLNDERYLMGGFLIRRSTNKMWRPEGGADVLVMHKKLLGENTPLHLTRLRLDGTTAWSSSIGLADLKMVCDAGDTIVFTGFADMSEPTDERPERLVMIDERTGATRTVTLQE